jgi:hypothetical protein
MRKMTAKEMFEKLGYEYKLYDNEDKFNNGIQYYKKDKDDFETYVEFYFYHKRIWLLKKYKNKIAEGFVSNINLLQAINKQIEELGWK